MKLTEEKKKDQKFIQMYRKSFWFTQDNPKIKISQNPWDLQYSDMYYWIREKHSGSKLF